MVQFPQPLKIARRNFWERKAILEYIAALGGRPAPALDPDDPVLLTSQQVRRALGGVSEMWVWRRLHEQVGEANASGEPPP